MTREETTTAARQLAAPVDLLTRAGAERIARAPAFLPYYPHTRPTPNECDSYGQAPDALG